MVNLEVNYGIPAVGYIVDSLTDLARDKASEEGMPHLRLGFTPTPVGGKTQKELDAYVAGNDPVTRKPMMPELIDYLTKPLTA